MNPNMPAPVENFEPIPAGRKALLTFQRNPWFKFTVEQSVSNMDDLKRELIRAISAWLSDEKNATRHIVITYVKDNNYAAAAETMANDILQNPEALLTQLRTEDPLGASLDQASK